jgi:hypothetical protein
MIAKLIARGLRIKSTEIGCRRRIGTMTSPFLSCRALAAVAVLALAACAWANPTLTPKQAEEARELVRQLGDPSYRVRDAASGRLVRMGLAVAPILREGLNSSDAEIRFRCLTILPLARSYDLERRLNLFLMGKVDRDNPAPEAWDKFKEMVGDTRHSREVFAGMHRLDSESLAKMEDSPTIFLQRITERCTEFAQVQTFGRGAAGSDQLALLLFAMLEVQPSMLENSGTSGILTGIMFRLSDRPRGKDLLKNDEVIHKLLLKYIVKADLCHPGYCLGLVANLELKEGPDILRAMLKDSKCEASYLGMAISLLGKVGGKASVGDIIPFLGDNTATGQASFPNNVRIETQMRDIALATLVQLSGQNLRDYEFPYAKMTNAGTFVGPNQFYASSYFGFVDDAGRTAAFKKWDGWYAKNKGLLAK